MPLYEFNCLKCSRKYEELCGSTVKSITCPQCGGEAQKILSAFRTGRSSSGSTSSSGGCGG